MSASRLAYRYAKSLLDLAIERGKVKEIYNDVLLLNSIMESNREFVLMIESPIIHTDRKHKILHMVLDGKVNDITLKFIDILLVKGREAYLIDMTKGFIEQYNKHQEITPVKLITPIAADENLKNKVMDLLKQRDGLVNIELTTEVDPSLIGGFVLQYEDKLYDASVKNKIEKLKREFSKNSYVKSI